MYLFIYVIFYLCIYIYNLEFGIRSNLIPSIAILGDIPSDGHSLLDGQWLGWVHRNARISSPE